MFSAGYDIGEIPAAEFEERAERLVAHPFTEAIDALEAFPYPTLAMLPGHTIGGGLCGASSMRSGRRGPVSCFCSAATSTLRPRCSGGSSRASPTARR
jgi:hypothetical protein